jgi:GntR family transcriptional repressor for pyruvate dehydrogenase complex
MGLSLGHHRIYVVYIMLDNFSEIKVETPVDMIIRQIRNLISSGQLASGDRLPAERKMAERFGVSRNHVRDALQKLEFYGILRTLPQSGTVVAGMGITALEGLITDVLQIEEHDFAALVETRVALEVKAAQTAALRRTPEDLVAIQQALLAYEAKLRSGNAAVEEDLLFHLKVAEAGKNGVLKSLMLVITPDIINNYRKYNVCEGEVELKTLREHEEILYFITKQNAEEAGKAMQRHLQDVTAFSQTLPF